MRYNSKYIVKLVFGASLILLPASAQAACASSGYTVIYINGIRTTEADAQSEKGKLESYLGTTFNKEPLSVLLGYNESHGTDIDAVEAAFPDLSTHDIDTILIQLAPQIQTRKIILVGYSQGAMYANRIYDYLIHHGEPAEDIKIYGIATPETIQTDIGGYANFYADTIIYNSWLQQGGVVPPPPNLSAADWWNTPGAHGDAQGHDLISVYFDNFADRIVSEIQSEMFTLRATNPTDTGTCFEAPQDTAGHKTVEVALKVAGPTLDVANAGLIVAAKASWATLGLLSDTTTYVASIFSPKKGGGVNGQAASDAVVAGLHALNITTITPKINEELRSGDITQLGAAAVLAEVPDKPDAQGEVLGEATTAPQTAAVDPVPFPTATDTPAIVAQGSSSSTEPVSPGPGLVSAHDLSAASPSAPASAAAAAPVVLTPPQDIVFSNWQSPSITDTYCDVDTREADISWDPVPGASSYQVWQNDTLNGDRIMTDTVSTSATDLNLEFGLNWSNQITLKIVALDGAGDYATTSIDAQSSDPDRSNPGITSTYPAYGATGVAVSTPIKVTYSEALDPASVTSGNFGLAHINYPASPYWDPIGVAVALEGDGQTVDITPTSPLLSGERYNINTSCAVKDLSGNHAGVLSGDPSYNSESFTTATSS